MKYAVIAFLSLFILAGCSRLDKVFGQGGSGGEGPGPGVGVGVGTGGSVGASGGDGGVGSDPRDRLPTGQ